MVPGNPKLSLTTTWALGYDPLGDWAPNTPFVRALQQFLRGDDAERGNIFKLIPRLESRNDATTSISISVFLPDTPFVRTQQRSRRGNSADRGNIHELMSRWLCRSERRRWEHK